MRQGDGELRSSNGESSRKGVRIVLTPGEGLDSPAQDMRGCRTLPSGFAMSPKDLAVLMEVIRASGLRCPRIDQLDTGVREVLDVPCRADGRVRETDGGDLRIGGADRGPG